MKPSCGWVYDRLLCRHVRRSWIEQVWEQHKCLSMAAVLAFLFGAFLMFGVLDARQRALEVCQKSDHELVYYDAEIEREFNDTTRGQ